MKTIPTPRLAILLCFLATMEAEAGGSADKSHCKLFSGKRYSKTDYALLPFRAIPWAAYYIVRIPGQVVEYAVYGETGERLAGTPDAAPSFH